MDKEKIKELFKLAHESIESRFKKKEPPISGLIERQGLFVTLTINGQLRGCIGQVNPRPIGQSVIQLARSAAFSDPRFKPLTSKEYEQVIIELSILEPPVDTARAGIKRGDGVIINKGFHNALFLPQVWDQLPDKKEFLDQLFLKAGLMPGEAGINYQKFRVEAWIEQSPKGAIQPVE